MAPTLNNENPIYEKISECLNYKNNIQKSLEMFQLVMQLDTLLECINLTYKSIRN